MERACWGRLDSTKDEDIDTAIDRLTHTMSTFPQKESVAYLGYRQEGGQSEREA